MRLHVDWNCIEILKLRDRATRGGFGCVTCLILLKILCLNKFLCKFIIICILFLLVEQQCN